MENTARPITVDPTANQTVEDVAHRAVPDQAVPDQALPDQALPDQALIALKAEIVSDASRAPAEYLRDSIVPEGGE
jgi:hypothetical protein